MSNRFRRDFKLIVGLGANQVEIVPPFNISFSVTESIINKSLNSLNIQIPGLKKSTREKLIKYELDKDTYLSVEFYLGYEGNISRVFKGSVRTGELSRNGVMFSSKLECYDGHPDFNKSYTSRVVTGRELAVDAILEDMPNTGKGTITELTNTLRPKVLVGASSMLLADIANGKEFYIKDEKIFMLGSDDVISAIAPIVSAKTGLIGVPQQDHIDTVFTTKLNPSLKIGGLCEIVSVTNPVVNGLYKIYQLTPNGAYKGAWEQTVTCRKATNYSVKR